MYLFLNNSDTMQRLSKLREHFTAKLKSKKWRETFSPCIDFHYKIGKYCVWLVHKILKQNIKLEIYSIKTISKKVTPVCKIRKSKKQ